MKSNPEVIELDEADLESKLDQIEAVMGVEIAQPFRLLLRWYAVLLGLLREKNFSILRLKRILFGASTERTANVLSSPTESSGQLADAPAANPGPSSEATSSDQTSSTANNKGPSGDSASDQRAARGRRRGHGRIPASQYTGCVKVLVTHPSLHPGDICPDCGSGTVYRQSDWSPVVRLKGQPPVGGHVYQLERLRCDECGKIYTAQLPEEAGPDKYDPTVVSVVATLRYGEGMPGYRLQQMQRFAGVPLPASDQWERVRDAAERGPREAYQHLLWLAAQGQLVHNDDTKMRVLELMGKAKRGEPLLEDSPDRRGVFT